MLAPWREETRPSVFFEFRLPNSPDVWNDKGWPEQPYGNVIGLEMALSRCGFRAALENLAGIIDDSDERIPSALQQAQRKEVMAAARDGATFENTPFNKELGGLRQAVPYFEKRGITEETAKEFGAGFYNGPGLMRGWIVFPVKNREGTIMSYVGRAAKKKQEAEQPFKIPPGFHISLELFNIDRIVQNEHAREAVRQHGIIIVEGFSDVLKLWQEGFYNVVAVMGDDLSAEQQSMILDPEINPTRRVTLFLDNDEAGIGGKRRAAKRLVHNAWIRYVDYNLQPTGSNGEITGPTDPKHFVREELEILLAQPSFYTTPESEYTESIVTS